MKIFKNKEFTDINCVYELCNGNEQGTVPEYSRQFSTRRLSCRTVFFSSVHRCLKETGKYPQATSEHPTEQKFGQEEAILNMVDALNLLLVPEEYPTDLT